MRRRRQLPDTRLDWRDPEMPCLLKARHERTGQVVIREFSPEEAQYQAQHRLSNPFVPSFKHDPTYNLRRK